MISRSTPRALVALFSATVLATSLLPLFVTSAAAATFSGAFTGKVTAARTGSLALTYSNVDWMRWGENVAGSITFSAWKAAPNTSGPTYVVSVPLNPDVKNNAHLYVVNFCSSPGKVGGCAISANVKSGSHLLAYTGSDPAGTANHPTPGKITPPPVSAFSASFSGKVTAPRIGSLSLSYVNVDWLRWGENVGGSITFGAWRAAPNTSGPAYVVSVPLNPDVKNSGHSFTVAFCRSAGTTAGCGTSANVKLITHTLAYSGADPTGTANHPTPGKITPPPVAGFSGAFSGSVTAPRTGKLLITYTNVDWVRFGESLSGQIAFGAWKAAPSGVTSYQPTLALSGDVKNSGHLIAVEFCRSVGTTAGCASSANVKRVSHTLIYSGADPTGTANHPTPGKITPPPVTPPPATINISAGFSGRVASAAVGQLSIWYIDVDWLHVGESVGGTIVWQSWIAAPNMGGPTYDLSINLASSGGTSPHAMVVDFCRLHNSSSPTGCGVSNTRRISKTIVTQPITIVADFYGEILTKSTARLHISYNNVDWLRLGESVSGTITWGSWTAAPNLYTTYNPVLPINSTLGTVKRTIVVDFCAAPHSPSTACGTGNTKRISKTISLVAASSAASGVYRPGRVFPAPTVAARDYTLAKIGTAQFSCLDILWDRESGWRVAAQNASSGAYGIPQALPGTKMASVGSDWQINATTQVKWGLGYISGAYGAACNALRHFYNNGWY